MYCKFKTIHSSTKVLNVSDGWLITDCVYYVASSVFRDQQAPSRHASVNLVYDKKLRRYAEDNRTEFNCTPAGSGLTSDQGGPAWRTSWLWVLRYAAKLESRKVTSKHANNDDRYKLEILGVNPCIYSPPESPPRENPPELTIPRSVEKFVKRKFENRH